MKAMWAIPRNSPSYGSKVHYRNRFAWIAWKYWGVQKLHRQNLSILFLTTFPPHVRALVVNTGVSTVILAPFGQVILLISKGIHKLHGHKNLSMLLMNSPNLRVLIDNGVSTEISAPYDQVYLLILRGIHKLHGHVCPCSLWYPPIRAFW